MTSLEHGPSIPPILAIDDCIPGRPSLGAALTACRCHTTIAGTKVALCTLRSGLASCLIPLAPPSETATLNLTLECDCS